MGRLSNSIACFSAHRCLNSIVPSVLNTHQAHLNAQLATNGGWSTTGGTASALSINRTNSGYLGFGGYFEDHVKRSVFENGYEGHRMFTQPQWTLATGGSWSLSGGTGGAASRHESYEQYAGSGTYTKVTIDPIGPYSAIPLYPGASRPKGAGQSTRTSNITRTDAGHDYAKFDSWTDSAVSNGVWGVTSGSGSGTGHMHSTSTYTENGT